jgi:cell surface protein SprA
MPTQISYRTEMLRDYKQTQLRNLNNPSYNIPLTMSKDFNWNRYFDLRFNFTKSLKFDFSSKTNARIDEPEGPVDKDEFKDEYELWKDSVITNIRRGGRVTNYQHNFNVNYNLPINKLPYLNWVNSNIRYAGNYNWITAPQTTTSDIDWGNTINNGNNIQGTVNLNMNTLYNQSKYLKGLSRKYSTQQNRSKSTKRTVRYNKDGINLIKGQSYIINHKLKTSEVRVRMFDQNGRTARGKTVPVNDSKIEFIPEADYNNARVMVTGTVEEKSTIFGTVADYSAMLVTGVKNISFNYTENNATTMPGYLPSSRFLGTSSYNGFSAPGYSFIAGFQDRDFARKAAENDWITVDTINQAYLMTHTENISLKASIQPINGLRIDLDANRRYSNNMDEYYFYNNGSFDAYNTRENGNFSMTYNIIRTAFKDVSKKGTYDSETYNKFIQNTSKIKDRLVVKRKDIKPNYISEAENQTEPSPSSDGYGLNSQDVLIPAFLSAYSGTNPDNIFLDLFPSILSMQPNWRVTYNGLSKIKFFQKYIRSFDITHTYKSTYKISSYTTNIDYKEDENGISWFRDELEDNFISEYQVNSVTLEERFSPLIGFNITWKNSLITKFEIEKSRLLNLSLTNNQLIENYKDEFTIGLGYRFDKMDMILGSGRNSKKMSSDLNLRFDLSIRDNIALIRKIEDNSAQLTSGQKITTVKFTADYVLSDRFNMQVFYDRNLTNPYISTSYPLTTSNFGVSFSFSLTQ